jgi:NAD(P)-dependent dehydrogenase (short-subunit alcohol dehydrogenase family)
VTARVVVGAAGLLGRRLVAHLADEPGRLLAVDAARFWSDCRAAALVQEATSPQFAEHLQPFVRGASRAELYFAAGFVPNLLRIRDTDTAVFRRVVERNLVAAFTVLRTFAETARLAGVPGSMTVLGSVGAERAHRYLVAYDAAKAGLASLVRSFALEYGLVGITSRLVAIGPVARSVSTVADGDRLPALVRLVPLGRYLDADEVAVAVATIGGPAFDAANGHTIDLDGGLSVQLRPADVERPPAAGPMPRSQPAPAIRQPHDRPPASDPAGTSAIKQRRAASEQGSSARALERASLPGGKPR